MLKQGDYSLTESVTRLAYHCLIADGESWAEILAERVEYFT